MKKFLKIVWNIIRIVFILVLFLYLTFIVVSKISTKYSIFNYRIIVISNSNMNGIYNLNDVVLVKDYNTKKLKIGDDITYRGITGGLNGKIITSRIINIDKNNSIYTTKGVSTSFVDPSIKSNQILGKVIMTIPIISEMNKLLQLPIFITLFVFIPLFLIILLEILKTIKEIKQEVILNKEKEIISYELSKKPKKIRENDYGNIEILENIKKNIDDNEVI